MTDLIIQGSFAVGIIIACGVCVWMTKRYRDDIFNYVQTNIESNERLMDGLEEFKQHARAMVGNLAIDDRRNFNE